MRVMAGPARPPDDPVEIQEGEPEQERWWETENPLALTYDDAAGTVPDDPDPARMPSAGPVDVPRVTLALQRDVAGKTAFWLLSLSEFWALADPYCGMAAADAVPGIAKKAAPILCGSPDIVRWFTKASGFMQWTELLMACKPVFVAVIAHHVTKSVQLERSPDGTQEAQKADWSAYTAA
jgi:hypothetical protein